MANEGRHPLLMLGDQGVGKRCITLRFAEGKFGEIIIHFLDEFDYRKRIKVEQYLPEIQIQHPPDSVKPRNVEPYIALRAVDGAFIVYSITSRSSFDHVRDYVKQVEDAKSKTKNDQFVLFLVGNKSDCEVDRQVSIQEGEALAISLKIGFAEVSAKINENVDEAFRKLVLDIWEQYPRRKQAIIDENKRTDIVGKMERFAASQAQAQAQARVPFAKGGFQRLKQFLFQKSKSTN